MRLSRVTASKGDAYVDMITYEHTRPDTWDREASLLGIFCDKVEAKKRNKHFLSVEASDSRNEFVLFAIHEYGGVGPQAEASIDSFVSISPDPVKLKTHVMRRIAAMTAEHVHRQLHGRIKGHAVVRPAAERAADEGRGSAVADDVTEQTSSAGDVMAVDDGRCDGLLRSCGQGGGDGEAAEAAWRAVVRGSASGFRARTRCRNVGRIQ